MDMFDTSSSHNTDILGTFYHIHNFLVIHNDPWDRNCFDADENNKALKYF